MMSESPADVDTFSYADPADLPSLRIRTAALLINFVFGVVFMTIGGGGTNKPDNTYETAGTALVTSFTQVRVGSKPGADGTETQSWSAVSPVGLYPLGSPARYCRSPTEVSTREA